MKFQTENFDCWTARVGEVVIGNETISVYETSVIPKDFDSILNEEEFKGTDWRGKGTSELEFFEAFQKLFNEIQKEEPFSLIFIASEIDCYVF